MASAAVHVGFRSERGPVLISLMLSTGLVAIDSTIIATAVPSVVASLGGFAQFPWLFSVYLLTQAVSVPIYGKLADLFGRKPIMLLGIGLFLLGSVLCGFAWSMPALIAFRALQGLGAGAVQPMSLTIAADLFTLAERGRVQGYLASVWAMSAVIGPTLGGVFSEYVNWRLIFFVNIPLCLIAAVTLIRNFREKVNRRTHKLDYAGSALLAAGCSLLILALLEAGNAWEWLSAPGLGVPAAGAVLLVCFVLVERRAAEPVLPMWIFRRRVLVTSSLVSFGVGAVLLGLTSYVPTFVQGVLGAGPLVAGFALATLTVGWPITASQSGRVYTLIGFRATALIGSSVTIVGAFLTTLLSTDASVRIVGATCFVVGAGLGFVAGPTLIAAQATVGWSERGVVTGTNMFSRSIGSAVGVAVFGAIANASLGPGPNQSAVAMNQASHYVFVAVVVVAVLMGLAVLMMPRTIVEQTADVTALVEAGQVDAPVLVSATEPSPVAATKPAAPRPRVPESAAPQVRVPESAAPQSGVPASAAPQVGVPESAAPQPREAAAPQVGVPESAVPQVGVPESAVPQVGVPESAAPQPRVPDSSATDGADTENGAADAQATQSADSETAGSAAG